MLGFRTQIAKYNKKLFFSWNQETLTKKRKKNHQEMIGNKLNRAQKSITFNSISVPFQNKHKLEEEIFQEKVKLDAKFENIYLQSAPRR